MGIDVQIPRDTRLGLLALAARDDLAVAA